MAYELARRQRLRWELREQRRQWRRQQQIVRQERSEEIIRLALLVGVNAVIPSDTESDSNTGSDTSDEE